MTRTGMSGEEADEGLGLEGVAVEDSKVTF